MRCCPERLALLALAACAAPPADNSSAPTTTTDAPSTSSAADASVSTGTTESTGSTGDLDCGALTRCGLTCVDLASDPDNCGDCGIACRVHNASAACTDRACSFTACDPGHHDCDDDLSNGCETPGAACPLACAQDLPELCNLFDDDCDAACDELAADCRHPVHRAHSPTRGHLYTLDPREAASADYTLSALAYLYLYTSPQPGLVPLYRCRLPDEYHYYTTSANCDDVGTMIGVLGHLAPTPLCGGVPLFRLSNGTLTNYLYTHDPAERDDAIAAQGFAYEAIAGHVWTTP